MGIYGSKYTLKAQEIYKATPTTTKLLLSLSLPSPPGCSFLRRRLYAPELHALNWSLLGRRSLLHHRLRSRGFFPGRGPRRRPRGLSRLLLRLRLRSWLRFSWSGLRLRRRLGLSRSCLRLWSSSLGLCSRLWLWLRLCGRLWLHRRLTPRRRFSCRLHLLSLRLRRLSFRLWLRLRCRFLLLDDRRCRLRSRKLERPLHLHELPAGHKLLQMEEQELPEVRWKLLLLLLYELCDRVLTRTRLLLQRHNRVLNHLQKQKPQNNKLRSNPRA